MNTKEREIPQNQGLIEEIGSEVSQESAPLLEFITKNGGKIAAVVIIFLLITGLSALWQWHTKKDSQEFLLSMTKAMESQNKKEGIATLENLAHNAPGAMQSIAYLTLANFAAQNSDQGTAQKAYAQAAAADADGVSGIMASFCEISTLMKMEKYAEAMQAIATLEARFPTNKPLLLRELKAYAAQYSGDTKLAAAIFADISKEYKGEEGDYFLKVSQDLSENNDSAKK